MTSDGAVGPTEGREWPALPEGVRLADGIDLDSPDPARVEGRRICVATKKAGGRCASAAIANALVCAIHDGRADPAAGGRARAERRRLALVQAQDRVAERSLGVRAAVGAALAAREADLRRIVDGLVTAAASGDRKAAALLLPYIDQALGRPVERIETGTPSTSEELESLSTSELEALIASGRAAQAHRA